MRFSDWLIREIDERGWTQGETARRAGISASMLSKVISESTEPGLDTLTGIARGFGLPLETILRRAGILPPLEDAPTWSSLAQRLARLPATYQAQVIDAIHVMLDLLPASLYAWSEAEAYDRPDIPPLPRDRADLLELIASMSDEELEQTIDLFARERTSTTARQNRASQSPRSATGSDS